MNFSITHGALALAAATIALTGCSSEALNAPLAPPANVAPGPDQLSLRAQLFREVPSLARGRRVQAIVHPDRRPSWMSPSAKSQALLYIADEGTYDVYVYSYPAGALVGTLTGFNDPEGLCTDKAGNVFVANTASNDIVEYAHGGTSAIKTLDESGGEYPYTCAVNPRNGDLAVMNINNSQDAGGNVQIFKHATGTPTVYTVPNFFTVEFGGYDPTGNLFVWGNGNYSSDFSLLAELPAKSTNFSDISLPSSIGVGQSGNDVAWDGKYMTIGAGTEVYQITVSGGAATVVGTTSLGQAEDVVQYTIPKSRHKGKQGKVLVGPDCFTANVKFWKYPSGGYPTKTISGLELPFGSAVSK